MKVNIKKGLPIFSVFIISLCWFALILEIGVFNETIKSRSGVFPTTFTWWEMNSWKEHLFLGVFESSDINEGRVYTTYTYPFLLANYMVLYPLHKFSGINYEILQNMLVYFQVSLFIILIYRLRRKEISSLFSANSIKLIWLFLTIGLIITNSLPWISFLRYNTDNFHFFVSLIFCYLSVIHHTEDIKYKDKRFLLAGLLISCISIIYIIPWMLCYLFSEHRLTLRKQIILNFIFVSFSAIINYTLPIIAQKHLMLKDTSSGFFYRSGLDGSSVYLKSTFSPYFSSISEQHIGNCITLLFALGVMIYFLKSQRIKILNQVMFNFIPFIFIYIMLPQFCTIHAYLVEFLFVTPCVFLLVYWLLSIKFDALFTPKKFVLSFLFVIFILMGQLMEIAKTFEP
jgi:hypothetical protein